MYDFRRVMVVALLGIAAAGLGFGTANAQALNGVDVPAEFPPVSYAGKQYVDSRGCVFIRAGIDGDVVWVPRVNRDRKLLCGFAPTVVSAPVTSPKPPVTADVSKPAAAPQTVAPPVLIKSSAVVAAEHTHLPKRLNRAMFAMPKGFKPAWDDGRLNPDRGPKTTAGNTSMGFIWTNTVPRKLISGG